VEVLLWNLRESCLLWLLTLIHFDAVFEPDDVLVLPHVIALPALLYSGYGLYLRRKASAAWGSGSSDDRTTTE
jgi:hypothetical protein